jgi:small GTP-binding protein
MVEIQELKTKICLIGDWGVGKTSLIRKFVFDQFDDKYLVTLGTKVSKKRIKFKKNNGDIIDLNLLIWDVMGQQQFKKIQLLAYKNTDGVFIVCDITRKDTLTSIVKWYNEILKITGKIPIVILANKSDLVGQEKFSQDELAEVANRLQATYFYTSAKTGANIEPAFKKMGIKLISTI